MTNPAPAGLLNQFEKICQQYLVDKAPFAIPENIKELIVKYGPYLTILIIILAAPSLLALLGIGAVFMPFSYLRGVNYGFSYSLSMIVLAAGLILNLVALPGLFQRRLSAWRLMYYSVLVSALHSLISFNLGNLIISSLISLYVLFQIKSYYKN